MEATLIKLEAEHFVLIILDSTSYTETETSLSP